MGHHSEEEARRLYRRQTRRRFLATCGPAAGFALAGGSRPEEARALDGGSSRKNLTRLRATVRDGEVQLSAYKSTPAFEDAASQQRFRALRVYRRVEPDFTFGQDYEEYFDGLSHRGGDLVFEGPLPEIDRRKFTYVDRTAEIGATYAYWMAAADGPPTGPAAVKVRDAEVWWPPEKTREALEGLKRDHPDAVALAPIGRTVRGETLTAVRLGKGARCIALVGAVHAGESGAELIIPAFQRILAEHKDLLEQVSLAAIPVVNLDERRRLVEGTPWYLRTNAAGIDLNRNFPADWEAVDHGYGLDTSDPHSMTYRGSAPASEPETRAVMDFLRRGSIIAVCSFHCLASICGAQLLGPKCAAKDEAYAKKCLEFATAYCRGMDPSLPEEGFFRFGTSSGSLPAWCYRELHAPAFDFEISSRETEALQKCRVDKTDRPLLKQYQRRHANGLVAVLQGLAAGGL